MLLTLTSIRKNWKTRPTNFPAGMWTFKSEPFRLSPQYCESVEKGNTIQDMFDLPRIPFNMEIFVSPSRLEKM
ncbi:hypothetical protein AHF37_11900 [Paragonimus kellicotti]|nr:hypothetical protein AHF37_11900 [Paragonimus kellicotti]